MGSRSTSRRIAMQAVFQSEMSGLDIDTSVSNIVEEEKDLSADSRKFAERLAANVLEKREELDEMITKLSKNWTIDRMSLVDKCILRLALYEMKYEKDTPKAVIINEALELSKRYSDERSSSFINGILGAAVV
jgi:N utilization substance protein B